MLFALKSKKMIKRGDNIDLPPFKKLLRTTLKLSIPAAIETFLVGLVTMVDTMMVGKLGKEAIASITLTTQPVYICMTFAVGLSIGTTAIIARRRGEERRDDANKSLRQTLVLGSLLALLVSTIAISVAKPLMLLMGAKPETSALPAQQDSLRLR